MTVVNGIKENKQQFILLAVINLFVGSMVGIERTVLPSLAEEQFGITSTSAALSFIVSFGFSKAIVNYFAGSAADRFGRRQVLIAGWSLGLFVPILILTADAWWMIVVANVLLGANQGLAWSMTLNMKMDLAGDTQRGLAAGVNEFAGYIGVALLAAITGFMASSYQPFVVGIGIAVIGLLLSLKVKDTSQHLAVQNKFGAGMSSVEAFKLTTWQHKPLSAISFAGLATNLKDGMAWGLFPLYFASAGVSVGGIGFLVAVYPAAWGFFQLFTGALSDKIGRRILIAAGMVTQAGALWLLLSSHHFVMWTISAILLGVGTAMVYPVLQAAVSDYADPSWRASSMGVYRFWRDSGYAFGALLAGFTADLFGLGAAIGVVAILPFAAGIVTFAVLKK
ncbi:MFS transporter [Jeotgalibacillus salarius]|uniref:MFS transporter n=1 Tax=Jeotgalibacillus salarius TaxID=546023 RepID=A0A4Y8LFR9_9BACL|nr:MFS transporter [Jeotgalibacillus salarius]TFE01622.1 MFS transporter [Jeotgalibacillus salarius]